MIQISFLFCLLFFLLVGNQYFFQEQQNPHSLTKEERKSLDKLMPQFVSYVAEDPEVVRYEEERKALQKLYKGRDFVDVTLAKLYRDMDDE